MAETALARVDQLGAFLQETISPGDLSAQLLLDIASGMVRDFLNMEISAVDADVVLLEPVGSGNIIILPEWPVTAVSLVETFDGTTWTTADPSSYTVSLRLGIITGINGYTTSWPFTPGSWRVTYDHGFGEIPMSIVGVCLGIAARQWSSPIGLSAETLGGYSVKYAMETDGLSAMEQKALARYRRPPVG